MRDQDRPCGIPGWESVADKWLEVLDDYVAREAGDTPQWYGERATLSTLAGAIWTSGGICLQEYACEKGEGFGRGDLWFRTDAAYTVEAKQYWTERPDLVKKYLSGFLESACTDVGRHHHREGASHRLGVVFVTPRIAEKQGAPDDEAISAFLDAARSADAHRAWWFPPEKRDQRSPWKNREGIYPGVIMVSRYCGFVG